MPLQKAHVFRPPLRVGEDINFLLPFLCSSKFSRSPAAAGAEAVTDIFGFSAGARRLPNSALHAASPKIVLFALPERAIKLQKTHYTWL